jgi:uncharacterized protein YbjT (DUF2867 family)
MKILVIGASGMLAKPVINQLDRAGFQLRLFSRTAVKSMFFKDYEIVNGDMFNQEDLDKAMEGCDAIHISIANDEEAKAVRMITDTATRKGVKLISYVSGATVSDENRWFRMIDNKFSAEQSVIRSGIPYLIFRPTWFFESLHLMVRNGKATIIGKQKHPYHWIALDDFAWMVTVAFLKPETWNRIYYIMGTEKYLMKDLLERYCKAYHPEVKRVTYTPVGMLRFIANVTRKKELRHVADLFGYFEKTPEAGDPEETYNLLARPEMTFEKWLSVRSEIFTHEVK